MNIRVGFGYDVHKLVENRDLWLGGIKIDNELGLLGHSDADGSRDAECGFQDSVEEDHRSDSHQGVCVGQYRCNHLC